jgi:hypothetical protein
MTDDRDWSWLGRGGTPPPAAPAADHFLWALEKPGHRVECRARHTPGGPELRIVIDRELWWSRLYRGAAPGELALGADTKRLEFEAKGWTQPGPREVQG